MAFMRVGLKADTSDSDAKNLWYLFQSDDLLVFGNRQVRTLENGTAMMA